MGRTTLPSDDTTTRPKPPPKSEEEGEEGGDRCFPAPVPRSPEGFGSCCGCGCGRSAGERASGCGCGQRVGEEANGCGCVGAGSGAEMGKSKKQELGGAPQTAVAGAAKRFALALRQAQSRAQEIRTVKRCGSGSRRTRLQLQLPCLQVGQCT